MDRYYDQDAQRDIFNAEGNIYVNNEAAPTAMTVALPSTPPVVEHWQTRQEEDLILGDFAAGRRFVEIISAGGYGKSALAAQVFEQVTGFDKKLWVSFQSSLSTESGGEPFRVFGQWLGQKLGYRPGKDWQEPQLIEEGLNRLGQGRCLLVLDNLETLLQADGQWRDSAYGRFVSGWLKRGRGALVLTSRERPVLAPNERNSVCFYPLAGLPWGAAVRLLRDEGMRGSDAELRELVELAGGHPLLLRLAVGVAKAEAGGTPSIAVLKRPELDVFAIVGAHQNDPETSIQKILDASMARLDEALQQVLLDVWVFPMPFTQKRVVYSVSTTATEGQLRQLAQRSWLQEEPRSEGWTFQFQPLIRDYLQQKLLNLYDATGDRLGFANMLRAKADVLQFLKRSDEALALYDQASEIYQQVGDRLGFANTLKAKADVLKFLKRSDEALALYDQASEIYQQVGARLGFANVLHEMGKMKTDLAQGLNLLEQAQAIYTQVQDRYSQSRNLLFIANIQHSLNQPAAALATLDRAATLAAEIGYEPLQTYAAARRTEFEARPPQSAADRWK